MFSIHELLSLDYDNSSSCPSRILILQYTLLELHCLQPLLHHFCQILHWPTEAPLQNNPHHVFHQFPYFLLHCSITRHHKSWKHETICHAKRIKFFIKIYTYHNTYGSNTLPIKKLSLPELLLFQNLTVQSTTILSSIQNVLNSFQNDRYTHGTPSFLQPNFYIQPSLQSPTKIRSSTLILFHPLFHHYLFTKSSLQSPLTNSIPLYLNICCVPLFA